MRRYYYRTILPLLLLIVVVSEQKGVNVQTNVQSTAEGGGTQEVRVETNVQGTSSSSTSNTSTVYKKVEVDVNGVKKVYESNEPGTEVINVTSDNKGTTVKVDKQEKLASPTATTKINNENTLIAKKEPTKYKYTYSSYSDYLITLVKNFFKKLFNS